MRIAEIPDTDVIRTIYRAHHGRSEVEYKHLPSGIAVRRERPRDISLLDFEEQLRAEFVEKLKAAGVIDGNDEQPAE